MTVPLNPNPEGMAFTRFVIAAGLAKNLSSCALLAEERWGVGSFAQRAIKAASVGGLSPSAAWGDVLGDYERQAAEFFAVVREKSIPGQMVGLRRSPIGVRVIRQSGSTTAAWVGEGGLKLVSDAVFDASILKPLKVAGIVVQSDELIRLSSSEAELLIRNDLVAALAQAIDVAFIDPANGGIPDIKPAAVTYGAPQVVASGDPTADISALLGAFAGNLADAFLIGKPEVLVLFSNSDNVDVGARGGSLRGVPAIASRHVPDGLLAIVDASAIAFGARQTEVQTAREGTVALEDGSGGSDGAAIVSLWQRNLVAIKAEQTLNWSAGQNAAAVLTGISSS